MKSGGWGPQFLDRKGGKGNIRGRARRSRRAVSDVVTTILLLGLTVVLFASIFLFVTSYPAVPVQNSSQFQAAIVQAPNGTGTMVLAITIVHLAGPVVPPQTLIYLKSSVHPKGPEFASPYGLTDGGIPSGQVWNLGQTWVLNANFTGGNHPVLPDNITLYIITPTSLVFSVVLPGTANSLPPSFPVVGTTPVTPAVGEGFTVSALIGGVTSSNTVKVTLSGLPGSLPSAPQSMTYSATTGYWSYSVSAGLTSASGAYVAYITASTTAGVSATTTVPVTITSYSTLIGNAITLGTPGAAAKCTGAKAPVAACQATNDYYYIVSIPTSLVTFGSVLFEVLTSTRTVYSATTEAAFALSLTTTPATVAASWTAAGGAMSMPSSGFTYVSPLVPGSALTTSYEISIDVGTVSPTGTGLSLLVLGINSYSGYTSIALP